MRPPTLPKLTALVATVALCAPPAAEAGGLQLGEQSGLGLTGPAVPEVLQRAKADPYATPAEPRCASIPTELAKLDEVLGPDADAPAAKPEGEAGRMIGRAVRSLIPHRDIVRLLTGAGRKEKALAAAAMAGAARRGYLKGLSRNLDCGSGARGAQQAAALDLTAAVIPTALGSDVVLAQPLLEPVVLSAPPAGAAPAGPEPRRKVAR